MVLKLAGEVGIAAVKLTAGTIVAVIAADKSREAVRGMKIMVKEQNAPKEGEDKLSNKEFMKGLGKNVAKTGVAAVAAAFSGYTVKENMKDLVEKTDQIKNYIKNGEL